MRRSEIFESFIKIAEEKGLVSKATPESNKEYLERTHRADSLSVEDIAKLYNTKPNTPKDMEYERNIVEIAHPDPLVIAPAYDKLNGLIENINERQDILLHIVNKTNDGQIPQRKYAEKKLILSLVRVGNDMDNRGENDLRILADACLFQATSNPLKKQGQWQIIPILAALVGGFYAKQHLRFHSDGFTRDYEKAIAELDDLLQSNSNWGVGYDYTPAFIAQVNDIKNKLNELNTAVQSVLPELDKLQEPRTASEYLALAKNPNTHEALYALQQFKKTVDELSPYFKEVVADFTNESYKQRQIQGKGWMTGVVDSADILHGGKGLVADDFDDVAHALQTILYDVNQLEQGLQDADQKAAAAQQQLVAAQRVGAPSEEAPPVVAPLPTPAEIGGGTPSPGGIPGPGRQLEQDQASKIENELDSWTAPDLFG
jgi:hypothetical protein